MYFYFNSYQELSHAEEEMALAISEGRANATEPLAITLEIDAHIEEEKALLDGFLMTDYDLEQFEDAMDRYLGRIGHLIGSFNSLNIYYLTKIK